MPPEPTIVLAVVWLANERREHQMAEAFHRLSIASRQEPGCLRFDVHQSIEEPRRFFAYEEYRDQAASDSHQKTTHFQQIARGELFKLGTRVEGHRYYRVT
jgi:autoinducer 2-degrading protein